MIQSGTNRPKILPPCRRNLCCRRTRPQKTWPRNPPRRWTAETRNRVAAEILIGSQRDPAAYRPRPRHDSAPIEEDVPQQEKPRKDKRTGGRGRAKDASGLGRSESGPQDSKPTAGDWTSDAANALGGQSQADAGRNVLDAGARDSSADAASPSTMSAPPASLSPFARPRVRRPPLPNRWPSRASAKNLLRN